MDQLFLPVLVEVYSTDYSVALLVKRLKCEVLVKGDIQSGYDSASPVDVFISTEDYMEIIGHCTYTVLKNADPI